jgi:uncharacterized protein YwgA
MAEQTKKLIAYLNLLGVKIDSTSFADRIKAQKLAYILQKLTGKQLYNDFNFYVRGPYSHELAVEYFNSSNDFVKGISDYKITKDDYEEIERAKPLINALSQMDLEIVASLLFLKKEKGLDENIAEIELKVRKPHLKEEDIWRGSNIIKKMFLTDKMRIAIMNSLHKEMEGWDDISNENLKRFKQ